MIWNRRKALASGIAGFLLPMLPAVAAEQPGPALRSRKGEDAMAFTLVSGSFYLGTARLMGTYKR